MALSIDDFSDIAKTILECVYLEKKHEAYGLIQNKLDELSLVEFKGNVFIQNKFIQNIGKLKFARDILKTQITKYDPSMKDAWIKLIDKLDERIKYLRKQKANHAKLQ